MTHSKLMDTLQCLHAALGVAVATSEPGPSKERRQGWMEAIGEARKRLEKREKRTNAEGVFVPPTASEVEEVMKEKGLVNGTARAQAEMFVAHHATRGWKLGKGLTMISWKQAVTTWVTNYRTRFAPAGQQPQRSASERARGMGIG